MTRIGLRHREHLLAGQLDAVVLARVLLQVSH